MSALVLEWSGFNMILLKRKEDLAAAQEGRLEIYNQYACLKFC